MLFDDLQQYDPETCALLHYLARGLAAAPVLIIATYNSGEVEREAGAARLYRAWRAEPRATVVSLPPLSVEEVGELIRDLGHISSRELGTRFCRRIYEVTKGNPFYVLELLKALFDQGALVVDPDSGEWNVDEKMVGEVEMPMTIRETMAQRLAALPYQLRDLLTIIAVGRVGCSAELLAQVTELPRLQVATLGDELIARRLAVEEEGTFRIAHPLIADVIRRDMSDARLAELHRAFALGFEEVPPPKDRVTLVGRIARHAERGGLPEVAYRNALLASRAAVDRLAYREALSWLDLAAQHAPPDGEAEVDRMTREILLLDGTSDLQVVGPRRDSMIQRVGEIDMDLKRASSEPDAGAPTPPET